MEKKDKIESTEVENNDVLEQANMVETVDEENKKKKRKIGKIILNILTSILFVIILLDAIIGIINMQRINNKEEPIWYLSTKKTETELKTVTEYHLGLYKIVITDTAKETKTTLKPFFLSE